MEGHILSTHLFLAVEISEKHRLAGPLHYRLQVTGKWAGKAVGYER